MAVEQSIVEMLVITIESKQLDADAVGICSAYGVVLALLISVSLICLLARKVSAPSG